MTSEEYLEWERKADVKHEYLGGEVYAHAGASDAHVTIAGNLFALLRNHVRGGPCRVYQADMKVRVRNEAFFYPDVVVTCDERDRRSEYAKEHPVLVVEVLSETTAAFDRGRKFALYRTLESLREYVLIDTDRVAVEVFRLGPDGHWVLYPYGEGQEVELTSVGFRCPIEALYEDVELGEASSGA
jgi:Uma2 family endonuclease